MGVCAAVLLAASVFVVSLKDATLLSGFGVILTFQIFLSIGSILLSLLSLIISVIIVVYVASLLLERFAGLKRRFDAEFRELERRKPALVATLVLVSEAYLIVIDKGFSGSSVSPLVVVAV